MPTDCIFCRIVAGGKPVSAFYEVGCAAPFLLVAGAVLLRLR
jgi:hypothetical protein